MADRTPARGSLLLIHGAWQGGWVWADFAPLLEAAGYTVDAPDLPGSSPGDHLSEAITLDLYVETLAARLDALPGPVGIIAHSGGGVIASALAEQAPERVGAIVYLAGMMLPSGVGFAELVEGLVRAHPEASGIGPHLAWSQGGRVSTVPVHAAKTFFLHDLPDAAATAAASRLTPQWEGGRALVATLTPERFGRVPRLYVEALLDRSVVIAAQREMQALSPGADVVCLTTGHAPHVSAPGELAARILPWLEARL